MARKKSPAEIAASVRDESPLKLTAEDVKFLNAVKEKADTADRKAREGKSGVVLMPVRDYYLLEKMAGKNPAQLAIWKQMQAKYRNAYPAGTELIRNELRRIRIRNNNYRKQRA